MLQFTPLFSSSVGEVYEYVEGEEEQDLIEEGRLP